MTIRCKFRVQSIKDFGGTAREVNLVTQYDQSIPEDRAFTKATPSGQLTAYIDNPVALEQLTIGKTFYVDLVPVE